MRCALNIVKHNNLGNQAQMKYVCSFIVINLGNQAQMKYVCSFIVIFQEFF
jgi:hypothetical protein